MTPSSIPVQELQMMMITSYQSGASLARRARSCRSVSMYGAFGKKISHKNAMNGMTRYNVARRHETACAKYASIKGIQARKRFHTKPRCLLEELYATRASTSPITTIQAIL